MEKLKGNAKIYGPKLFARTQRSGATDKARKRLDSEAAGLKDHLVPTGSSVGMHTTSPNYDTA